MSNTSNTASFTVTCPSNSNMTTYPGNTGSNYTVKLPKALNFAGQSLNDDTRWEVAMLSVHYTHNFINFREACTVSVIVDAPPEAERNAAETPSSGITELVRNRLSSPVVGPQGGAVLLSYFDRRATDDGPQVAGGKRYETVFGTLKIPARYYSNVSEVKDEVVAQFNAMFGPSYKLRLQAASNVAGGITFSMTNGKPVTMYANTAYLGKVLGLQTTEQTLPSGGSTMKVYKINMIGYRRPRLDTLHALYVYGNIVEHQHVGDTMAPLLAYVDVEKSPGERVSHICNPHVFLPVNRTYIDSIGIRICDEHGNNVSFPDDTGNVVVRLLFRKVKQLALF